MNKIRTEEILNSLDSIQRANADPYLYSKIRNRLEKRSPALTENYLLRWALALLIIAVLNLFTIFKFSPDKTQRRENAGVIASDYNISLPAGY